MVLAVKWLVKSTHGIMLTISLGSTLRGLSVAVFALAFGSFAIAGSQDECALDQVDIRSQNGKTRFSVEVAQTFEERATGLMHRDAMDRFAGMLFIYEKPQFLVFWMRNTLISLDILFIDENGIIRTIHKNAATQSDDSIIGGQGMKYVLEINAGMSTMLGITEGAEIRHPLITGDSVVWTCD